MTLLALRHKYLMTLWKHYDYNNMSTSKLIMLVTPLTYYLQKLHHNLSQEPTKEDISQIIGQ